MAKLEQRPWWPELLKIKDDYSLRQLALRFDVSASAINVALKRNGLGRRKAASGRPAKGRKSQEHAVPQARGRHARQFSELRLEPFQHDLGRRPDREIAEKAGLSAATVARVRRSRGIPAPRFRKEQGAGGSRIDRYEDLLGVVSDAELARLADVSRAAVRNYRVRRGIPSSRPSSAVSKPAFLARDSQAAWLVKSVVTSETVVVLASSILDALLLAENRGVVPDSISKLSPLLPRY